MKNDFETRGRASRWPRYGLAAAAYVYIPCSFILLDLWIRYATRSIGRYPLSYLPANLFTLCWAVLFSAVALMMPRRWLGRAVYGTLYFLAAVFTVVEDVYYQLMGTFLYFGDFLYAGEGTDYLSYVTRALDFHLILHIALLIAVGVAGILLFPAPARGWGQLCAKGGVFALGVLGVCLTPRLYGEYHPTDWDAYITPAFQYERFVNANADMELTGVYQYAFKNAVLSLEHSGLLGRREHSRMYADVDSYFEERPAHADNDMTGAFAGKNVILVMMESMDDWLITPEDTPTLYRLREESIDFTQMYTPEYANGYTFNTEFAAHTGVYPYTNSNVAYGLAGNYFPYALANLFEDAGYRARSFHRSNPDFYNRKAMHKAFGYEAYYSYYDYWGPEATRENDRFLPECDTLYAELTDTQPFFDFIITYSPHLPYDLTDPLSQEALAYHPEYGEGEVTELDVLRAKVRLTDDMFELLLQRLEEDGLLDDTVIVAFADHYAYALSDEEYLREASERAGSSILQRTPFFIWTKGGESMKVDKTIGSVDITPTLANLFGLRFPERVMGRDAFDPAYEGYVIFPDGTWLSGGTYVVNWTVQWNDGGLSEEDIRRMNAYVSRSYEINDDILNCDYYRHLDLY